MKNIFKNIIRDQFHATENHNSEEYKTRFHNYVNSVEYKVLLQSFPKNLF